MRHVQYVDIARTPRAQNNEYWCLIECLKYWQPPEPFGAWYQVHGAAWVEKQSQVPMYFPESRDRTPELVLYMPYPCFVKTARSLDDTLLAKMRVESYLVMSALHDILPLTKVLENHPMVEMWRGHYSWLQMYYNEMVKEWVARGYSTEMGTVLPYHDVRPTDEFSFYVRYLDAGYYPPWLGWPTLHATHRALLCGKAGEFYRPLMDERLIRITDGVTYPI